MTLKELYNKHIEAKVILNDFASRQRVHTDKSIDVLRYYFKIMKKLNRKLIRANFEEVFRDLVSMNYGTLDRNRYFLPSRSIRDIGVEALMNVPKIESFIVPKPDIIKDKKEVIIFFQLHGLKCKAYVPEDAIEDFEKLVNV